jgi:Dynamin family
LKSAGGVEVDATRIDEINPPKRATSPMTTTTNVNPEARSVEATLRVVVSAESACRAYERHDLLDPLQSLRSMLAEQQTAVVIAGEFKKGKSSLLNALLGFELSYVGDDIATQVPLRVSGGGTGVTLEMTDGGRHEVPSAALANVLRSGVLNGGAVLRASVRFEHQLLDTGLELVDSAGIGGLESKHGLDTLAEISRALGAIIVIDSSQEITSAEMSFLRTVTQLCPQVIVAMTKTDIHLAWRDILRLNLEQLRRADLDLAIVPVAVAGHGIAPLSTTAPLVTLTEWLYGIDANAHDLRNSHTVAVLEDVISQLIQQFERERDAIGDPSRSAEVQAAMSELKTKADGLRSQMAKWSQTLSDGIADLNADVDHDLRIRLRTLTAEVDRSIDSNDPGVCWDDMSAWLNNRVGQEMVTNCMLLRQRADLLAQVVGEHFNHPLAELSARQPELGLEVVMPFGALQSATTDAMRTQLPSLKDKGASALRGFYSTTLMVGLLGSVAGLALGPLGLVVGAVGGRKSLRTERDRQLELRRAGARQLCRKYLDEIAFAVGKELRDSLRLVQRQLRDHFAQRAEALSAGSTAALQAAQTASKLTIGEGQARLNDVEAELDRLRALLRQAQALRTILSPTEVLT